MQFKRFQFPAGESHVFAEDLTMPKEGAGTILYISRADATPLNDHIMHVLLALNVLEIYNGERVLFLPYLPYARQDRRTTEQEPCSIDVIAKIIQAVSPRLLGVLTLDVHSDVANAVFKNLISIGVDEIIKHYTFFYRNKAIEKTLVVPDQGAYKRLHSVMAYFGDVAIAVKHRKTSDGHLEIVGLIGDVRGKECMIMDDICDGGMTFIKLAAKLYAMGAKSVELCVTHGIFSKGLEPLAAAGISKVYTTNSYNNDMEAGEMTVTHDMERQFKNPIDLEIVSVLKIAEAFAK